MLYIDSEEDMLQLLKCDGWESLSFTKRAFSGARSLGGEILPRAGDLEF